jgi:hypothetical protein
MALHRRSHSAGRVPALRVAGWQRATLYASGGMLLLTGLAWLGVHYTVGAGAGELPHPIETWGLRLHGLGAFAGLFVLGALTAAHVPQGWRLSHRRRWAAQRHTGLILCGLGAGLALTGYALYYFAPEAVRPLLGGLHAAIGIVMAICLIRHRSGGRTSPL